MGCVDEIQTLFHRRDATGCVKRRVRVTYNLADAALPEGKGRIASGFDENPLGIARERGYRNMLAA